MNNFFECTSSNWVRYSEYEWKSAVDGTQYLTPTKTAQPSIYDPLANYQKIVLDAINIGSMRPPKFSDKDIQEAIRQFAANYGLLGLMTALPTTPNFMDYEAVYLPKNHFIKKETMFTSDYLNLFFPFNARRGVSMECKKRPRYGGFSYDDVGQAYGGKYELSAGICRAVRLDKAAVYRFGVYIFYCNALL